MTSHVRAGAFTGGLPYLAVGSGPPLVYLCGSTIAHRNPTGLQRRIALATVRPFARAGFEVYFTNRWPGMSPDISWPEVAARHATALAAHFDRPVAVLGHSTGGSLLLQLIADHPDVVSRAVVASAAYALGPVAREAQRRLLASVETTGRYAVDDLFSGMVSNRLLLALLRPPAALASRLIRIENPNDVIAMLRAEDAFDVRDRLEQISVETLVAYGGKDRFWTQEMFAETARRLPHGGAIRYPELGHNLVMSEAFVADVVAFLRADPVPR